MLSDGAFKGTYSCPGCVVIFCDSKMYFALEELLLISISEEIV
jgi:hypothetical protein